MNPRVLPFFHPESRRWIASMPNRPARMLR